MPVTSDRSEATRGTADATSALEPGRPERKSGWMTVAALVVSLAVVVALLTALNAPLLDAGLLVGLMILLPGLGLAQGRAARRLSDVERIPAYASSAVAISALGGLSLWVGFLGNGPGTSSLRGLPATTFGIVTAAVLAAAALVITLAHVVRRSTGLEESTLLADLLPRTPREKRAFAGLSLVAGFGEEVAYRGYAIPALGAIIGGTWGAAVLTSLAFGAVHAYQGGLGMARTAVLGMVLAVPVVLLGSLWPSVLGHVVIDLVGGLWLGPRMVTRLSSVDPG